MIRPLADAQAIIADLVIESRQHAGELLYRAFDALEHDERRALSESYKGWQMVQAHAIRREVIAEHIDRYPVEHAMARRLWGDAARWECQAYESTAPRDRRAYLGAEGCTDHVWWHAYLHPAIGDRVARRITVDIGKRRVGSLIEIESNRAAEMEERYWSEVADLASRKRPTQDRTIARHLASLRNVAAPLDTRVSGA